MNKPRQILTPAIIDYCQRCTDDEGRSIVAYCCHLSLVDQSVQRMEVDFVRAIADQLQISPAETAQMARKARRRRLKIKMPKSQAARKLLFHLALRMAVADQQIDARERSAIDRLAGQLRISSNAVESELQKLRGTTQVTPPPVTRAVETTAEASKRSVAKPKGFFSSLFDSLAREWVVEDLEADLFQRQDAGATEKKGEVEYTLTRDGDVELEIELNQIDLPANETVSVIVAGRHVCDIVIPVGRVDETIRAKEGEGIPQVAIGDSAAIQHRGKTLLAGVFEAN